MGVHRIAITIPSVGQHSVLPQKYALERLICNSVPREYPVDCDNSRESTIFFPKTRGQLSTSIACVRTERMMGQFGFGV